LEVDDRFLARRYQRGEIGFFAALPMVFCAPRVTLSGVA